jgi:hypothetical protein
VRECDGVAILIGKGEVVDEIAGMRLHEMYLSG